MAIDGPFVLLETRAVSYAVKPLTLILCLQVKKFRNKPDDGHEKNLPLRCEMHQGFGEHQCDVVGIRGRYISPCFNGFGSNICKFVS